MSVDKSKRKIAAAEYVKQTRLVVRKIQFIYDRIPQHKRPISGQYLLDLSHELLKKVYQANTIWVNTALTRDMALELLWEATGICNAMIGELDILMENPPKKMVTKKDKEGKEIKTWEESPKKQHYEELVGILAQELALLKGKRNVVSSATLKE